MKKIISIAFVFNCLLAQAQQVGMYSHAFFKPMVYNPAFTGVGTGVDAMLVSRAQWTDFSGAPQLNMLTLDGALANEKVGVGMSLISDRKGTTNRVGGNLNYAYRLRLNDETFLRLGLALGIINQTIDYSKALVENTSDPNLFAGNEQKTTFDANLGMAFCWKNLEIGAAIPQLAGNKIKYVDNRDVRATYTQVRHYLGTVNYKIKVSESKQIFISPQVLVRFVPNAPFQYDGTIKLEWKDKVWIGATYKSNYAVTAFAGFTLHKQLAVGYAYDFMIGDIGGYAGMSHELMLQFKFGKAKKEQIQPVVVEEKKPDYAQLQEKKIDSLQTVIQSDRSKILENEKKLKELNDKLNQQAQGNTSSVNGAAPTTTNGTNQNQNAAAISATADKVMENGIWILTNKSQDFATSKGGKAKGYYVIAGTFVYRDFAQTEAKRFSASGFSAADVISAVAKQMNYVFVFNSGSKEEALKKATDARASGVKDAWVLQLVD